MKERPATIMKSLARIEVKSIDTANRRFSGIASTFDVDLGGDVIERGAFAKTLADWSRSKERKPMPLMDQHGWDSVTCVVGRMTAAAETPGGLECEFEMLPAGDPSADAVWARVSQGFITGLSIGYSAIVWSNEKQEDRPEWDYVRHITELQLWEISAVVWPMNDDARIELGEAKSQLRNLARFRKTRDLTDDEKQSLRAIKEAAEALLAEDEAPDETEPAGEVTTGNDGTAAVVETETAAEETVDDGNYPEEKTASLQMRLRMMALQ